MGESVSYTQEQMTALIDAMDNVLDDMGKSSTSTCLYTKAMARIAFEPFLDPDCREFVMDLEEARRVVREVDEQ